MFVKDKLGFTRVCVMAIRMCYPTDYRFRLHPVCSPVNKSSWSIRGNPGDSDPAGMHAQFLFLVGQVHPGEGRC